jgi:hypothetical protein
MTVQNDSVIDFIVNDVQKPKLDSKRSLQIALVLPSLSLVLALLLRPDQLGYDSHFFWLFAMCHLLLVGTTSMIFLRFFSSRIWSITSIAAAVALLFLSLRPGTFGFEYRFANPDEFWSESTRCFAYGLITIVSTSVCLYFFLRRSQLPQKKLVYFLSIAPGLCGLAMLNIHCISDHVGHIGLSHWLPGLLAFPLLLKLWRIFVTREVSKNVGHQVGKDAMQSIV